ncbi:hypothetical protein [Niabella drilacis]|uniref:hypothetical protein n=1 Tax=Niabella drilacis (strain DSM 25811 / CCM 8410 / CCUG 62505 / LMG 26954 / E90) TaxID=1285928 RepID=UPI0015A27A15|nr:hypothetical protein [Niabella drilacis]
MKMTGYPGRSAGFKGSLFRQKDLYQAEERWSVSCREPGNPGISRGLARCFPID